MNWLIWLGVAMLAVWAFGWLVLNVAGAAIHVLLVLGAVAAGWWVVRRFSLGRSSQV